MSIRGAYSVLALKKFNVPQAKPNNIALQCEYLAMHAKMKPCTLDPHECVLGHKGVVSEDGLCFDPIEQPNIAALVTRGYHELRERECLGTEINRAMAFAHDAP